MKKKIIALLLTGTMLLSTGCSATVAMDEKGNITVDGVPIEEMAEGFGINLGGNEASDEEDNETPDEEEASEGTVEGGSPWVNSDIKTNIKEDMELSPKDDFHLYTNYDWLLKAEIPEGRIAVSSFSDVSDIVDKKALDMLNDDTLTGHDAELVQSYYNAILDWDARDKAGLTPVMDMVEDIEGISSLKELSEFISDPERSLFVPFFLALGNVPSYDDSQSYITAILIGSFILSDSAEYKDRTEMGDRYYEGYMYLSKAMLTRLGRSEDEAGKMFENAISIESKLAEVALTNADSMSPDYVSKINNVYKPDEIADLSEVFPLTKLLEGMGYGDAKSYVVFEPKAIERINELYTEDNLEAFKDYMLVRFLCSQAGSLDSEAYDAYVKANNIIDGSSGREKDERVALDRVRTSLSTPMDKAFLERYDASEKKERITKICEDVISVYREMLNEEDWMSEETREKAVEKLDSITINAVYPEKWVEYDELDLKDLSLYDCKKAIALFNLKTDLSHLNGKVDREIWSEMDILEANAYYDPQNNSINIILGILEEPFYYDGISDEELLGGIGSVIGHEISHAFDTNGAQYDKDGNFVNWWNEVDYDAFKKRADRLIAYYDTMKAWEGQKIIGANIQTEAIADMAGVKSMLKIAEGIDDFDYEKFFTSYAVIWRKINTRENEFNRISQDPHPLAYLRTNVTLQQYDEFHDTYDIKEGDNMYLAPEDRIAVW